MSIASPVLSDTGRAAGPPVDSMAALLHVAGFHSGPDGGLGIAMSVLAGIATALAVAITLSIHFRTGNRSWRDLVKYGLAACTVLGLLAFVIADTRQASLAYLGLNPAKPAIEFEIRLPKAILTTVAETQVELLTDRNQKLARLEDALALTEDGRGILRGTVTLDHRTTDRVVLLNLPGHARTMFRLRLPASPTRSSGFGPWHLADDIIPAGGGATSENHDSFAIRYRVL
ncbi:MAG: acriflavin resistance protein [Bradyrhizobium sp.]